jgi:hypothetical protein
MLTKQLWCDLSERRGVWALLAGGAREPSAGPCWARGQESSGGGADPRRRRAPGTPAVLPRRELGADYFDRFEPQRLERQAIARLERLGFVVILQKKTA